MKQTKLCERCKKEFITNHNTRFCSYICYWKTRWGEGECKVCGKKAEYRYCSKECGKLFWNKNDYHLNKKARYWKQKIELLRELGNKCKNCGETDIRVLDINHKNRELKKRPKKLHYTWQRRLKEWKQNKENLEILCANCHRIHTWQQMGWGKIIQNT